MIKLLLYFAVIVYSWCTFQVGFMDYALSSQGRLRCAAWPQTRAGYTAVLYPVGCKVGQFAKHTWSKFKYSGVLDYLFEPIGEENVIDLERSVKPLLDATNY